MVDNRDVKIRMTVEGADAKQKISDTGQAIQGAGQQAESSSRSFSDLGSSLVVFNQGLGLAQKALNLVSGAFSSLGDTIIKGSTLSDLENGFRTITGASEETAASLINDMQDAVVGTIDKLTLLQTANKTLAAGLTPEQFIAAEKAARRYADATGGDLLQSLNQLSDALIRGNDRALKAQGIIIDTEEANRKYAESIGVSADALNEVGKAEAIRAAALEALGNNQSKFGEVVHDSADSVNALRTEFVNIKDEIFKAIANNQDLIDGLVNLESAVKSIDWSPIITGITDTISAFTQFTAGVVPDVVQGIEEIQRGFAVLAEVSNQISSGVFPSISKAQSTIALDEQIEKAAQLKEKQDALIESAKFVDAAFNSMAGGIDISRQSFEELQNNFEKAKAEFQALDGSFGALGSTVPDTANKLNSLNQLIPQTTEAVNKNVDGLVDQEKVAKLAADALKKSADAAKKKADEDKKAADAAKKFDEELLKQQQAIVAIVEGSEDYQIVLDKLAKGQINAGTAAGLLGDQYQLAARKQAALIDASSQLNAGLLDVAKGGGTSQEAIGSLILGVGEAKSEIDSLGKTVESGSFGDNFLGSIFGVGEGQADPSGFGADLGNTLVSSVGTALDVLGSDGSVKEKGAAIGTALGGGIGAAIGTSLGGPVGGQIGASIGSLVGNLGGGFLGGLFGGKKTEGTIARKKVDEYFSDLFDADRLALVINGQLTQLDGLVTKGGLTAMGTSFLGTGPDSFFGTLASLPANVQQGFNAVGAAFENLLGVGDQIGGQVAAILTNNIGGSLNNLQLLVQATGKSLEEMKGAVVDSFLSAEIGAVEAQSAINGLNEVYTAGIPGAIGATEEALGNLIASAGRGRAAVDALGDLGAEGVERGLASLQDLQANLAASGKLSGEDVKKLFDAIAASGIQSLEDLKNVSNEAAIGILANLESGGFAFEKQIEDIDSLAAKYDAIQNKEATVKINVQTNFDGNTQEFISSGLAQTAYGSDSPGNL